MSSDKGGNPPLIILYVYKYMFIIIINAKVCVNGVCAKCFFPSFSVTTKLISIKFEIEIAYVLD